MKRTVPVLLVAGAVLLLSGLYLQTRLQKLESSERNQLEWKITRLEQLNSVLDDAILRARFRLLNNYDPIIECQDELTRLLQELQTEPEFIDSTTTAAMKAQLARLTDEWDRKFDLVHRFTSQNATLNNSLHYFPFAGGELVNHLSQEDHEFAAGFNGLMRKVLVYNIRSSETDAMEIQTEIERIKTWMEDHPAHPASRIVASLLGHVRVILVQKPKVENLTGEILNSRTAEVTAELKNAYQSAFAATLSRANLHRVLLYCCCAALLLGIIYAFYALHQVNRTLEQKVCERTVELTDKNIALEREMIERKRAQEQLVEASRRAGMAEVATGVLHNVGNVLNSVNVSASLISNSLKTSKVSNFGKAVELLRVNTADLALFLTEDSKGRLLPQYLVQLADYFAAEQIRMLHEIDNLCKKVDHIKDIVNVQQNYGRVGGLLEQVNVVELVEDTLRMHAIGLERHSIRVARDFRPVSTIVSDKHKILQILVNLVKNAKLACTESQSTACQMTIRVEQQGQRLLQIAVMDNGVGIPAENLVRIFSYGFTTRKNGHGFGLHCSALAAKEIGGSLNVHSDGPGRGAVFTLQLPCLQT